MSVYVDDMRAPFGRMVMCHMLADSHDELVAMADTIGVARRWIQHEGQHDEHFDIALVKRALAVKAGAQEITWLDAGRMMIARRGGAVAAYVSSMLDDPPAESSLAVPPEEPK